MSTSNTKKSTSALTDKDLDNLCIEVELAICECEAEEIYLEAFVELVVDRVKESGGEGMVDAVVGLGGESWQELCPEFRPRSLPPVNIQEKFIRSIEELDNRSWTTSGRNVDTFGLCMRKANAISGSLS